eukprot:TRINITY_DN3487_c0_g2_i1.p1 TRINITY_DN3487_c0_g2~~TRINITY_DN3487_c0_g2_i1.p1  ORF type:complete len:444 (+),score=137.73 TRINITY_DN3487_c0_g2_i1:174-1334(+)
MGGALPKPVTTKVVERRGNPLFRVGASGMNGMRLGMEDAHAIEMHDAWGFFGIFDGHVGSACSRYLADEFPRRLKDLPQPIPDPKLRELAVAIDEDFISNGLADGSAATFLMARPSGTGRYLLQVGNVGDSRVIVCKGGAAYPMTTDHKPSIEQERERIEAAGGIVMNNRVNGNLAMSRAFGDSAYKQGPNPAEYLVTAMPDITHIEVGPEDFVLLACDGVFESNFTNEEVVAFVYHKMMATSDIGAIANMLCDEALARGSEDNISCMILQLIDGTDYAALPAPQQHALELGPYSAPGNAAFKKAYEDVVLPFGITLVEAVQTRHDEIVNAIQQIPSEEGSEAPMLHELRKEIRGFALDGAGPPEVGHPDRLEWFRQWIERGSVEP